MEIRTKHGSVFVRRREGRDQFVGVKVKKAANVARTGADDQ